MDYYRWKFFKSYASWDSKDQKLFWALLVMVFCPIRYTSPLFVKSMSWIRKYLSSTSSWISLDQFKFRSRSYIDIANFSGSLRLNLGLEKIIKLFRFWEKTTQTFDFQGCYGDDAKVSDMWEILFFFQKSEVNIFSETLM